jgi:hypothetical protein
VRCDDRTKLKRECEGLWKKAKKVMGIRKVQRKRGQNIRNENTKHITFPPRAFAVNTRRPYECIL